MVKMEHDVIIHNYQCISGICNCWNLLRNGNNIIFKHTYGANAKIIPIIIESKAFHFMSLQKPGEILIRNKTVILVLFFT